MSEFRAVVSTDDPRSDVERVMIVEQEVYQFPWTERIFSDCIRVGYHCWLALIGSELSATRSSASPPANATC